MAQRYTTVLDALEVDGVDIEATSVCKPFRAV